MIRGGAQSCNIFLYNPILNNTYLFVFLLIRNPLINKPEKNHKDCFKFQCLGTYLVMSHSINFLMCHNIQLIVTNQLFSEAVNIKYVKYTRFIQKLFIKARGNIYLLKNGSEEVISKISICRSKIYYRIDGIWIPTYTKSPKFCPKPRHNDIEEAVLEISLCRVQIHDRL